MKNNLFGGDFLQYFATLSGCFAVIVSGINLGWSAPYLPVLLDPTSEIPTTSTEASWCAVMPLVGAPVGAILCALIVDRIGRKPTTLLMVPFTIISFLIIAYGKTILMLSIARFIIGSVEGGLYTVLPIYIAEIADPKIRGFLSSTISVAAIIGTLFINVIGPFTSIFLSSWICMFIPLVHFITFVWMPESPYYLIKKQRFSDARSSLEKLRGLTDVENEMLSLCEAVKRQEANKKGRVIDLFMVKSNRHGVIIYVILSMTNKFSGKNPLLFYTTVIFQSAAGSVDPVLSSILFYVVETLATIVALNLIDKFGRRPLLIFSAAGCSLALFMQSFYFFLKENSYPITDSLGWLPITALVTYSAAFSLGLAYGPVLLLGEMFPTNIKAIALCSADSFSIILGTIASQFFHITTEYFGMSVPFLSFAVFCVFGTFMIYKFLLETKGKTLEEIQMYFLNK